MHFTLTVRNNELYLFFHYKICTIPFKFVYRTADIYISAVYKLRESAEISAVRYTNLNGIVYKKNS